MDNDSSVLFDGEIEYCLNDCLNHWLSCQAVIHSVDDRHFVIRLWSGLCSHSIHPLITSLQIVSYLGNSIDQKLMKLVGRKVALMNKKSEFGHLCISYGYLGKAEPKENI